jgi:hypothetical protein
MKSVCTIGLCIVKTNNHRKGTVYVLVKVYRANTETLGEQVYCGQSYGLAVHVPKYHAH